MERFIPYEKLSKKKKRELDARRRNVWQINPVTRKPADSRAYNRKKAQKRMWETDSVPFVLQHSRRGQSITDSLLFPPICHLTNCQNLREYKITFTAFPQLT